MKRKTILLVDDVELFLSLERTFLQRSEFELVTARSGLGALQIIRESRPDLVLLDLYMPGMDGDECCRAIKRDERYRDIPVIMVTQGGKEDDRERCREAGCDAVVLKPINRHDLLETVLHHLRVKKRTSLRHSVRIRVYYGTAPQQFLTDYAVNLSTGGLFLETDHLLEEGTPLTVQFHLPRGGEQVECKARVAWTNHPELPKKPNLPPGIGLQFHDLSLDNMNVIRDYIQQGALTPLDPFPYAEPGGAPPLLTDPVYRERQRPCPRSHRLQHPSHR